MALKYNSLEKQLIEAGIPPLLVPEQFDIKNLRIDLIEKLHQVGIPEEHIALLDNADNLNGALSSYRKKSQFYGQPSIHFNSLEHFKFVFHSSDYSEFKVKEILLFSLLHAYGQAIYEYFNSEQFLILHKEQPYKVNQICRIMEMFFSTKNITGTIFANYALGKLEDGHRKDALKICIETYTKEHFSPYDIELSYLPRNERILRQDIDYLCTILSPNLTPQQAMDNNSKVVMQVADFLLRHDYYKVQIIRAAGYIGKNEDFPREFIDKGITPFLFTHEAVLCEGSTIIDFCALAYGQENPIIVGPKYKWKRYWNEFSTSQPLPKGRRELQATNLEFSSDNKH